jgi:PAS domain S-box-containing protein
MTTSPGEPALPLSPPALARLVDLAEDAILSIDEDQRIVLFNRGAERTSGYVAGEVIGRPLDVLIPARFLEVHRQHLRAFAAPTLREVERRHVGAALHQTGGNKVRAAKALGVSRRALYRLIDKHRLEPGADHPPPAP